MCKYYFSKQRFLFSESLSTMKTKIKFLSSRPTHSTITTIKQKHVLETKQHATQTKKNRNSIIKKTKHNQQKINKKQMNPL